MKKNVFRSLVGGAGIAALVLTAGMAFAQEERETVPDGKGIGTIDHPPQSQAPDSHPGRPVDSSAGSAGATAGTPTGYSLNGITYHGGPIITAASNIYYIWYGNWSGNSATSLLTTLANKLGGSKYFNINTTYTNSTGGKVMNSTSLKGSVSVGYISTTASPTGTSLTDTDIKNIVTSALSTKKLPTDANGVYFVLTSKDVKEGSSTSSFIANYCGWHNHAAVGAVDIKYAFVGDPTTQGLTACAIQATSPNGNPGADGMASVIAHELAESVTDPDLNAWYDSTGKENADKCAWTFGTTFYAANGSKANITLGGVNYLLQQIWVNAGGGSCKMSY